MNKIIEIDEKILIKQKTQIDLFEFGKLNSFLNTNVDYNEAKNKITFIDLFAGIGGIRLGFEDADCECVFSSEWDEYAQKTYSANFGEIPYGDITKINPTSIPKFDILCGGFPCQPFSQAGLKKGFDDTRGT